MAFSLRLSRYRFNWPVTILIVGVWLFFFGMLVRDRYFPAISANPDSVRMAAIESDDWFAIRIKGAHAGFGRSRQFRKGDHWVVRDDLNISLNIQGMIKPVRITSESEVDNDFRLISFNSRVASGIISFEQKGHMEGRDLVLDLPGPAGRGTKRLKLYEAPRISRSLGLPLPLTGLKAGDEFRIPIFDPFDGHKWDVEIKVIEQAELEVAGRNVEAWLVRAGFRTLDLSIWIDREGRLLKGVMPLGITVIRSDKNEIARRVQGARNLPDMMALSAVPMKGSLGNSTDLSALRLRILGVEEKSIPVEPFRQRMEKSELLITRESIPEATYKLPYRGSDMAEHLASSRFIRSDQPEIIAKARAIVGDENDPVKVAGLINRWVHDNLLKVPTPSIPDALTVLRTRQGDCNEHAVLAVALARAAGVPSRMALGLVNMGDAFYYHAWVTYWSGQRWFTGDPLMNQIPADPTHIALLYGDVDKHVNVVTFLGKLQLEVLEAR